MIKNIISFFKIKRAVRKAEKQTGGTYADTLAAETCQWVSLFWAGKKRKFLIHKVNFVELLMCGRFPNVLYRFTKGLTNIFNKDVPEIPEADLKTMADEEEIFMQELVKKSLVEPTYQELEEATHKKLKHLEDDALFFKTVIPKDFIDDLFLWYVSDWEEQLKKKSEDVISSASAGVPNTGSKDQADISTT